MMLFSGKKRTVVGGYIVWHHLWIWLVIDTKNAVVSKVR